MQRKHLVFLECLSTNYVASATTQKCVRQEARHTGYPKNLPVTSAAFFRASPDASYLITGGLGSLGLKVGEYLATHGARHLVLTGRSGVSTKYQRTALKAIEDIGTTVEVVTTDISDTRLVSKSYWQACHAWE